MKVLVQYQFEDGTSSQGTGDSLKSALANLSDRIVTDREYLRSKADGRTEALKDLAG